MRGFHPYQIHWAPSSQSFKNYQIRLSTLEILAEPWELVQKSGKIAQLTPFDERGMIP
jgi:hypothetical protein